MLTLMCLRCWLVLFRLLHAAKILIFLMTDTTSTSGPDGITGPGFYHLPETSTETSEMCDNIIEYTGHQTMRDSNC